MLVRGKSKKAKSDVQTVPVVHETNDQVAVCPQREFYLRSSLLVVR